MWQPPCRGRLRLRAGSGAGPVGEEMKRMFSYVALACGYGSPGMTSNWKHSITLNFHFPYVWMIYDEGPLSFSTRESIGVIFIVKNRYFSGFFLLFVAFICLIFSSTSFIRSMFDRLCRKMQHVWSYCKTKKIINIYMEALWWPCDLSTVIKDNKNNSGNLGF